LVFGPPSSTPCLLWWHNKVGGSGGIESGPKESDKPGNLQNKSESVKGNARAKECREVALGLIIKYKN